MKIQSAGQQKYQDLIRKPAERVRTAMIVWISLACLAFISFFSNVWVALILAAAAAVLAARNIGARRVLEGALDGRGPGRFFSVSLWKVIPWISGVSGRGHQRISCDRISDRFGLPAGRGQRRLEGKN